MANLEVTLVIRNAGRIGHEFMAGRDTEGNDFKQDLFADLHVNIEQVDGSGADQSQQSDASHAEQSADEHHADGGRQPAVHPAHYAVDVAIHVRLFHAENAQRTAAVLVRLQRDRRGYPVPHSRLGWSDTIAGATGA